ncbi:MAG: hypothetical protein WCB36_11640 [Burkholderiales bacterium]
MRDHTIYTLTVLSIAFLACGCSLSPRNDRSFGDAARIAAAQQTINPDAAIKKAGVGPTMDGRAAVETIDRYEKSFRSPPPQSNVFTIGVGSSSSGGQ